MFGMCQIKGVEGWVKWEGGVFNPKGIWVCVCIKW